MGEDTINVDGEEKVVREDTAKSYRGVIWALASVGAFIIVAVILYVFVLSKKAPGGGLESPATIENTSRR